MALSSAPLFLVKLPVGMMSGYLLEKYCPKEGERDSQKMWLIIGLTTLTSPILLTLCWNYVSKRDEEGEKNDGIGSPSYAEIPMQEFGVVDGEAKKRGLTRRSGSPLETHQVS